MMTATKRVLIADNRPDHLQVRQALFQRNNWQVIAATDFDTAKAILDNQWVHLAVIDLRLRNDDEPRDTSGLELARATDPLVPKIIITSWPSYAAARDALGLDDRGQSPAVSFVDKGLGFPHLLKEADNVFAHRVRINLGLSIEVAPGQSLTELLRQIKPYRRLSDTEVEARSGEIQARAAELEDLLRKLFHDADSIRLRDLTPGAGGSGVFQAQSTKHGATGEFVVVKFGQRERVRTEWRRFEHYVQEHTGTNATAMLGRAEETLHFGGARFTLVGKAKGGQPRLFNDFYAQQPVEQVMAALTTLFETTCGQWYRTLRPWTDAEIDAAPEKFEVVYRRDLPDELVEPGTANGLINLRRRRDALACAMERQKSLDDADLATLRNVWLQGPDDWNGVTVRKSVLPSRQTCYELSVPDGAYPVPKLPDPVEFIQKRRTSFPQPAVWAITHGDLHGGNVLVDDENRVWLIDFYKTGWGPALRDFAQMEAAVRLELVETDNMTALVEFEQACTHPRRLDEEMPFNNRFGCADLDKALRIAAHIRWLAMKVTGISNMREYYVCLLYHTLRLGTWEGSSAAARPFRVRQAQALISAGLICKRLDKWRA